MSYSVRISHPARHDIGEIYEFLRLHDPAFADRWLTGLHGTLATLRSLPHRGQIAHDSPQLGHVVPLLLYRQYRIGYIVLDSREVVIVHITHSALGPPHDE